MDFETRLKAIFEEKASPEYASTQINIPDEVMPAITELQNSIPETDLAEKGLEDKPHITIKFGIHDDDPKPVKQLVKNFGPIDVTFGETTIFSSDKYDVLVVGVDSDDLHTLNKKIKDGVECTDTHPTYKPHLTIAYLKSGKGEKYKGRDDLAGTSFSTSQIMFSTKDRKLTKIS